MDYRLSRCDFQGSERSPCSFSAVYRVTLVSVEGPTCEMLLCSEHVEESWALGNRVLRHRFPDLKLNLERIKLERVDDNSRANRPITP